MNKQKRYEAEIGLRFRPFNRPTTKWERLMYHYGDGIRSFAWSLVFCVTFCLVIMCLGTLWVIHVTPVGILH